MLSFEDFFKKKRIDLNQFQEGEPALFAEFSNHYPLMGEKSFDHTKKYWFNNLRRTYPLKEPVKPHAVQAEAISQTAMQGVAVAAAQNANAAIERPKFKEDNLSYLTEENVSEQDISSIEIEKSIIEDKPVTNPEGATAKTAFKPRFNAKNIKKPEAEITPEPAKESEPATENPQPATEAAKPAFKPRFNMQNIKKEPVKTASETEAEKPVAEPEKVNLQPETEHKPAYKPRFQMKNVKPAEQKTEPAAEPAENLTPEPETKNMEPETESTENKEAKPVYKPRFQMKNIKPQAQQDETVKPAEPAESLNPEPEHQNLQPETESTENKEAKPVYKPRFQMKNIKPQAQQDETVKPAEPAESLNPEPEHQNLEPETESTENKEAKPVYKPRFQMKNMPKPAAENLPPETE